MTPAEILSEFKRKYEATYVFVQMPDSSENNLFYLSQVHGGKMTLESEEFGKIQLNTTTAHTIKFAFPTVGVFQNGKEACLFVREPRRQWQRGLCAQNGTFLNVHSSILGQVDRGLEFDFTTVANAFAGKTYTYAEALKMLESGKYRSVALGEGFSVMLSPLPHADAVMMFWKNPVATIKKGVVSDIVEPSFESYIRRITQ